MWLREMPESTTTNIRQPSEPKQNDTGSGSGRIYRTRRWRSLPFGIKEGIKVYLDESLKKFETVFPACGSGNSAIELTIPELEQCSGYSEWVNVCKEE